jgi:hypothetical protein
MRRWHEEAGLARRRRLIHLRLNHGWPAKQVHCACEFQAGRFRKHRPLGCEKQGCMICKGEKLCGIPRFRDEKERRRAEDSIREFGDALQDGR